MKKKVLLSSILTIALCLSLIAGSTFALFTSSDEVNIAVTAGKVEMVAGVAITKVESVVPAVGGTITDEFGGKYAYDHVDTAAPYEFKNTGTAEITGNTLTLNKITPGDKVTFEVSGANGSDVTIQYRYIIECTNGLDLMKGLVVNINNVEYNSLGKYTSAWNTLTEGNNIAPIVVSLELPVDAGNEYQEQTTDIKITVEAVQGNAATSGVEEVVYIANSGNVADLVASGANNVQVNGNLTTVSGVVFTENALGNGVGSNLTKDFKFINCKFTGSGAWSYANNVTYENCTFDCGAANAAVHLDELAGNAVFNNCTFISGKIQIGVDVDAAVPPTVTFNNCEFGNTEGTSIWSEKGIRVYCDATFVNCEFNNRVVLAGSNDLPITFTSCTMNGGTPVYYNANYDGIIHGGNVPTVTINP